MHPVCRYIKADTSSSNVEGSSAYRTDRPGIHLTIHHHKHRKMSIIYVSNCIIISLGMLLSSLHCSSPTHLNARQSGDKNQHKTKVNLFCGIIMVGR